MKAALQKLFGFRSRKPWKMIVASVWYLASLVVLFFAMTTPPPVPAGGYDAGLYRLSAFVIFLWMLSPALFLSDTFLRQGLPLFKNQTRLSALAGMMVVFLFFTYLFASVESMHTQEYKQAFTAFSDAAYQSFVDAGKREAP